MVCQITRRAKAVGGQELEAGGGTFVDPFSFPDHGLDRWATPQWDGLPVGKKLQSHVTRV